MLCQDDCKGLCVHCGANKNVSPCSCESFVVDPRLAVLRTLLDEKDDD
nr:YceD family protein [Veillonella sp.]